MSYIITWELLQYYDEHKHNISFLETRRIVDYQRGISFVLGQFIELILSFDLLYITITFFGTPAHGR